MKKKGFVQNTFIMFVAMLVTKALGAILKIPLGNILGGEGMGYFTTAYSIFTPVLAFTSSGIPTIVTQVTAAYSSQGKNKELFHFRKSALMLGGAAGLAGTAVILIASVPFAYFIANSPKSLLSILIIAPTVFACSVTAVYRGYYEGMSDMLPTAVSQMIEAAVKAGVGVALSYYVYIKGYIWFGSAENALPYAAAAAVFGVMISEFCGTVYITCKARRDMPREKQKYEKITFNETLEIMKSIFIKALPLAIGAAASNLISFADMLTISNCINLSQSLFPEAFNSSALLSGAISAVPNDIGNFIYGSYSGMVLSVYMLTSAASAIIARCSLPKLVCAVETRNTVNLEHCTRIMLKGTAFISVPISMMMTVLSEPILSTLYPVRLAEVSVGILPLQILSLGGIAGGIGGSLFTMLNAYGDFKTPVKITLYSGLVKFILNVCLITIPQVNISGAAVSTVVSGLFCTVYAFNTLKKKYKIAPPVFSTLLSPLLSGSAASLCLFIVYNASIDKLGRITCIIFSLAAAAFMYIFLLFISDPDELGEIIRTIRRKKPEKSCK